ncbi:MAG: hypothetical protein P1V51_03010 [Deltaproteobacteria bacterium]|nr:hypothetical protein [Deltaproteobacteria bacterium]
MSRLLDLWAPAIPARRPVGYRLPALQGAVRVLDWREGLRLVRLSPVDLTCRLPGTLPVVAGKLHQVQIVFQDRVQATLQGLVTGVRVDPESGQQEVDLSFTPLTLEAGRRILAGLLAHLGDTGGAPESAPPASGGITELIREARRIRTLLRGLIDERPRGRVVSEDGRRGQVALLPLAEGGGAPLRWSADEDTPEPPFQLELQGYNSIFHVQVRTARREGGHFLAPLPTMIVRRRNRLHRRVEVDAGEVSLRHPVWPGHSVRGRIVDLSHEGLAFEADPVEDVLYPGLVLPRLEVALPGEPPITCSAQVRHLLPAGEAQAGRCGLWLSPSSPVDRERWIAALARRLYPGSEVARDRAGELWEVFRDSGYFGLSDQREAHFVQLRESFTHFCHKLGRAPGVGYQVVHRFDGVARGTVTMVKPYAGTWVGYQLARRDVSGDDARQARRVLREVVLHGYEHAMTDPGFRWFVTWIQTEGRFSRLLMNDLTRRYTHDRDRACLLRFRAFQAACDEGEPRFEVGPEVSEATPWELQELLSALARIRPRPYLEAHDLVAGRLELGEASARWGAARLQRERAILIARRQGLPRAAAVLEVVEAGAHLFGLFDLVRLFPLIEGGERHFQELLQAARDWYRIRGKHRFTYFCETRETAHATELGMKDLGEADLTVLSAELMPEQLEHAWEVTFSPPLEVKP